MTTPHDPPRFSVPVAGVVLAGEDDEEDDEEDDIEEYQQPQQENLTPIVSSTENSPTRVKEESIGTEGNRHNETVPAEEWKEGESTDGIARMGRALVQHLRPSLQAALGRIAELSDNQRHLLTALETQKSRANDLAQLTELDATMSQLPLYVAKVGKLHTLLSSLTTRVEKLEQRTQSLQSAAETHALARAEKVDEATQWNKLYAVKASLGVEEYDNSESNDQVAL